LYARHVVDRQFVKSSAGLTRRTTALTAATRVGQQCRRESVPTVTLITVLSSGQLEASRLAHIATDGGAHRRRRKEPVTCHLLGVARIGETTNVSGREPGWRQPSRDLGVVDADKVASTSTSLTRVTSTSAVTGRKRVDLTHVGSVGTVAGVAIVQTSSRETLVATSPLTTVSRHGVVSTSRVTRALSKVSGQVTALVAHRLAAGSGDPRGRDAKD